MLAAAFGDPSTDLKNIMLKKTFPWLHGETTVMSEVEKGRQLYMELFGDASGNEQSA